MTAVCAGVLELATGPTAVNFLHCLCNWRRKDYNFHIKVNILNKVGEVNGKIIPDHMNSTGKPAASKVQSRAGQNEGLRPMDLL